MSRDMAAASAALSSGGSAVGHQADELTQRVLSESLLTPPARSGTVAETHTEAEG